jgi:hypothetical protein
MTRIAKRTPVIALLGLSLLTGTAAAAAQPDEVKVGDGTVLVGETGTPADLALDEAALVAARADLAGRSVAIVLYGPDVSQDDPEVQGAKAAIESVGAAAVFCDTLETRRRKTRCGRDPIDAAIIYSRARLPILFETARGLPLVGMGVPYGAKGAGGWVEIVFDQAAWGLATGRAAGTWGAEAWPDGEVIVAVGSFGGDDDPVADAVAEGVLEILPSATIVPLSPDPEEPVTADLYTGGIFGERMTSLLELDATGVNGQPIAVFLPFCPDPMPTGPNFAGCLRLDYNEAGAAAVDVIASLRAGREVPGEILYGTFEAVAPAESAE